MKTKVYYWIFTGLLTAFCLMGSFFDISKSPDALALLAHLGYPSYFAVFIGVMRLLGVIAILIPGYPIIKEWAYAGLAFDMGGALYSSIATGDPINTWTPAIIGIILVIGSYFFYKRMSNLKLQNV